MARPFSKGRRKFLLPAFLLLIALLFLWYRNAHQTTGGDTWHSLALSAGTPIQRMVRWAAGFPERSMEAFRGWIALQDEKERLVRELQTVQLQLVRQKGIEAELESLKATLQMRPQNVKRSRMAQLISQDASTWNRSFVIDAGSEDGVVEDSPVISVQGVVGRVWNTSAKTSRVLGILDPSSGIAGIDVRSRIKGLVRGTGRNRLIYDYVNAGSDIETGDLVVTSGLGGIYPKNIPIGTVVKKTLSENGMTLDIELVPSVDFGALECVFVLERYSLFNP